MTNGNYTITSETKLPLKVTAAIVIFAVSLAAAWLDLKRDVGDVKKENAAMRRNIQKIGERLHIYVEYPTGTSEASED